jgi:hypothetical protein
MASRRRGQPGPDRDLRLFEPRRVGHAATNAAVGAKGMRIESVEAIPVEVPLKKTFGGSQY